MIEQLLAHVPVSTAAKTAVLQRFQEPHRRYHNLDHVLEMWNWHTLYGQTSDVDAQIVSSFCLYHDAFYDPQAKDNERLSANLWLEDSLDADITVRNLVDEAIIASADHFQARQWHGTCSINWCLHLDLLRLGTPEDAFTQHGLDIRAEYSHLNDQQWIKASAEFRAKAMAQPTIFQFAELAAFEAQARSNLANALVRDWQLLGYVKV